MKNLFPILFVFVFTTIICCGCASNLPVFHQPQYESMKLKLGILPFNDNRDVDKKESDINLDDFTKAFADVAYNSNALSEVKIIDVSQHQTDCDLIVTGKVRKFDYREAITLGTIFPPLLWVSGGIGLLSLAGGKEGLEFTRYAGYGIIVGGLVNLIMRVAIDKSRYSHSTDGMISFKVIDYNNKKIVLVDSVSYCYSIIFSHESEEQVGEIPHGWYKEVVMKHESINPYYVRAYCEHYVQMVLSEKIIDKVLRLYGSKRLRTEYN